MTLTELAEHRDERPALGQILNLTLGDRTRCSKYGYGPSTCSESLAFRFVTLSRWRAWDPSQYLSRILRGCPSPGSLSSPSRSPLSLSGSCPRQSALPLFPRLLLLPRTSRPAVAPPAGAAIAPPPGCAGWVPAASSPRRLSLSPGLGSAATSGPLSSPLTWGPAVPCSLSGPAASRLPGPASSVLNRPCPSHSTGRVHAQDTRFSRAAACPLSRPSSSDPRRAASCPFGQLSSSICLAPAFSGSTRREPPPGGESSFLSELRITVYK
ncbi:uncharacterized protein WM277_027790 [Molossus nigricans]